MNVYAETMDISDFSTTIFKGNNFIGLTIKLSNKAIQIVEQ